VDRDSFNADPDQTFHFDGDPDPTPSFTNVGNMKNFVDFLSQQSQFY
jgi:hypothetical protein